MERHWEWWGAALGWGQWWSTALVSACSTAGGRNCPSWLGKCRAPGKGAPWGTLAPAQPWCPPALLLRAQQCSEQCRFLCGHSLALPCSAQGWAHTSCSSPCPQPRPPPVMPRGASSPHQTLFIFISAQAAALLFGVHSQKSSGTRWELCGFKR